MPDLAVGLIGVGDIGSWFTKKLLHADFELTVHDVDEAAVEAAVEDGASAADSPAAVAEHADVILFSLPGRPYVESVMEADDGVLAALDYGQVVVDTSTSPPDLDAKYARLCAKRDAGYVDSPLTRGGPGGDDIGPSFTMFVGGEREYYERARPVIEVLAQQHALFGGPGSGHVVKAAHRMRQNCRAAVDWEFTELLRNNSIDPQAVDDLLELGVREAVFNDTYPSVRGFKAALDGDGWEKEHDPDVEETKGGTRLRTSEWAKDPGYALAIAHASNTYAPLLSTVYQTQLAAENYAAALFERDIRYGDPDWNDRTAPATVYRRLNRPADEWRSLAEQTVDEE